MKIILVAGEPSGDKLGAALMKGLKAETDGKLEFRGVGGPLMQAEGLDSLFPMDELSVMGIAEVLPKLRHLFRRRDQTADAIVSWMPDALVTIDSPDFCLRVAKSVKKKTTIPTIHYVAPSVWAWRPKRAEKMARYVDHVLALLPFEPPYMHEAGMSCDFVGHPIAAETIPAKSEVENFKSRHGLTDGNTLLVLPGSRKSEIERMGPIFGEVVKRCCDRNPNLKVVVPTVAHRTDAVRNLVSSWPGNPVVLDPRGVDPDFAEAQKRIAFAAADTALATSGTVSLELAAAKTPMVIAYDASRLSMMIMQRALLTDTVTLVNLVSETRYVSEFIGRDAQPDLVAEGLIKLMEDENLREAQIEAHSTTMKRLGQGELAPGHRAAKSVLSFIRP